MPFSIRHESDAAGYVVALSGDADANASAALGELLEGTDRPTVTVDLTEVTLVDSRVMAQLVHRSERLREAGGDLIVVCADPNILRLFRGIGLDSELTIVSDRGDANTRTTDA